MPKVLSGDVVAGVVDASLGFRHGSLTAPSWTVGTGTPEGAVAAPIGSLFSRTDGGADTALYRKEAGAGTTGWIATTAAPADAVSSVDGRTGAVVLSDLYVNTVGDSMSGALAINAADRPSRLSMPSVPAPVVGADVVVNGSFTSNLSGWTVGANWAWTAGTAKHTAGSVENLTQDCLVANSLYRITVTTTGRTAGYVRVQGLSPSTGQITTNGTVTVVGRAAGVTLTLNPSTDWDGAVDSIVVENYAPVPSMVSFEVPAGTAAAQLRIGPASGASGGNVGLGLDTLMSTTTGGYSTAIGHSALRHATTGGYNVAVGTSALNTATSGERNTALGSFALSLLDVGTQNVAIGYFAFGSMTNSGANVAVGYNAGYVSNGSSANATTTGSAQTLIGYQTGALTPTQVSYVTALGYRALVGGHYATALGSGASAGAAGAVAIGVDNTGAGATTSTANEICLGTTLHTVRVPGGLAMSDAANIAAGTTTGTKIGTSATQKLAFWNATPVAQNTGWSVTAGYTPAKTLTASTATLQDLANVVATLMDTLKSYGMLG